MSDNDSNIDENIDEKVVFIKLLEFQNNLITHAWTSYNNLLNSNKITPKNNEGILEIIKNFKASNIHLAMTESGDVINSSNSIIATRGSKAAGIIKVKQLEDKDLSLAFEKLLENIHKIQPSEITSERKEEVLELLGEIIEQANLPTQNRKKSLLRTIGEKLNTTLSNIGSVSSTFKSVWPIIEKLWV
ncbi:hypothetical protein [Candidatus Nitrosocosmicus arcticus]|uniref:Uncharacterized protein n=1 Tax=Candidatus Nitrosocosmicus arcticus TaxID=2035267 RepID=A0A557SW05_9ARCH|nr:hypothetical protein [Candidatus Nitrosocosmicus arcticus]TVP40789.1 hypothetical protein NARC_60176 [Candidatus Nitrosocosmicus arcticus]